MSVEAARLYAGGVRIHGDRHQPCRERNASLAMREVVDQLAKDRGIRTFKGGSIKDRIDAFESSTVEIFEVVQVATPARENVDRLVQVIADFVASERRLQRYRPEESRQIVLAINIDGPDSVFALEPRAAEMSRLYGQFSKILHGHDPSTFDQALADFETLLLDLLNPDAVEDFAEIDELIARGPHGGK